MKPIPTISVIMPVYGAAKTLATAVESVQAQTLENWELIIIDDGSTDNSADIARQMAHRDTRITVIQQENRGPSAARNHGIASAQAPIVAFLDADDFWANERLSGMLSNLCAQPDTGIVFSRTRFVNAVTLRPGTLTPHRPCLDAACLMAENPVCSTSNIVCRRAVFDTVGQFTSGLNHAEDQDWLLRVALDGRWKIRGVNAEWFYYRSNETSQSADLEAMRHGWLRMAARACIAYPSRGPKAVNKAFGPIHRQLARRALRMGKPAIALRFMAIALKRDPLLLIRQPRRTTLTVLGALLTLVPSSTLKELVAR